MIILYVLLVVYILSVNFYAFLLVKSLKEKERAEEIRRLEEQAASVTPNIYTAQPSSSKPEKLVDKPMNKLCITGLLGGAITIYVCMFIYKYKRSELLLMVLMPLLGILNIYFWILMFKSGFGFFIIR